VLFRDVPPFDVLTCQTTPYAGFGEPLATPSECERQFLHTEKQARDRISEVFALELGGPEQIPAKLEAIIGQMWSEGWDPERGDTNLFSTDFGCLLTEALHQTLGGCRVFRSATDLSHLSLWWPERRVEAFGFHKTYKRLLTNDGESLVFFARRLLNLVQPETDEKKGYS
jgi:hypothetical protein